MMLGWMGCGGECVRYSQRSTVAYLLALLIEKLVNSKRIYNVMFSEIILTLFVLF